MTTKDFKFELKSVAADGTFEGYLSVFDVVDLGGDLVEKGAFTKTIKEAPDGFVPMLWQHDSKRPIGKLFLTEDDYGLKVRGELTLAVGQAQEAYELLKAGVIRGLSIGFKTIRKATVEGVRRLKEIQLFEGSVVTFPMLPLAQITSVKADEDKADFVTYLERYQVYAMRRMMLDALCASLDSTIYGYTEEDDNLDAAGRVLESANCIDQFRAAYIEHLPKLLEMWGVKHATEEKAGRRISATSRAQIEEAITKLQALLTEDAATSAEEADADKSIEKAPPEQDKITPNLDQELHLMLKNFTFEGVNNG